MEDLHDLGVADRVLHFKKQKITDFVINRMKDSQFKAVCDAMSQEMEDIYQHVNMGVSRSPRFHLHRSDSMQLRYSMKQALECFSIQFSRHSGRLPSSRKLRAKRTPHLSQFCHGSRPSSVAFELPTLPPGASCGWQGASIIMSCGTQMFATTEAGSLHPQTDSTDLNLMATGHILSLCSGMTGGVLQFILKLADEQMFLVEAKRHVDGGPLLGSVPEAVSQAIVLGEFLKYVSLLLSPFFDLICLLVLHDAQT